MRVLIGGGSGFVGKRLGAQLRSAGCSVTNISRSAAPGTITWNDLERNGLPECDAIVNLAGENIGDPTKRWNESFKKKVYSSRIDSTKLIVRCLEEAQSKPKVWVSSSAVGFYAPSPSAEYTEESAGGNHDYLAHVCADWEDAAQLPSSVTTRHVTIRIGLVLGRDGGAVAQMFYPFYFGVGGTLGSGKQWFPWIHLQDCAAIIKHAIESDTVTGVLNAVAPQANTNKEFTQALAAAMWRPAIFPLPGFVIKTVFGVERAAAMLEGQKVIPKRTLESGYKYSYPDLKSACAEIANPKLTGF